MSSPFEQLLEFKWRDVSFPATDFHVSLRHDLAQHKFTEKDGADVEATGRAPLQFTARIPFLNNISPAKSESWTSPLYPGQWRKFFAACANKAKGTLQHPELGLIRCRIEHADTAWAGDKQGGVFVDASWIETLDDVLSLDDALTTASPIARAIGAGQDLDAALPTLGKIGPPPGLPQFQPDFADTMRSIQGVFDQESLLQRAVVGQLDSVAYRVNALANAIDASTRAPEDAGARVQGWQTKMAIDRMRSAVIDIRASLLTTGKPIAVYVPQDDTTMPLIAQTLASPINDLMKLNPSLLGAFVVPSLSRVRYYLANGSTPVQQPTAA